MSIQITVYGKPGCQQCRMTTRHLHKLGLSYLYRDVTRSERDYDAVAVLGHQSVPVVVVGDMHWFGYRPEKLDQLAKMHVVDVSDLDKSAEQYLAEASE